MGRVTDTTKYKNFTSWHRGELSDRPGYFDKDELEAHKYLFDNIFKHKNDGFIIDVGANDGYTISHSLPFIDKGWSALMIEPNPKLFNKMVKLYSHIEDVICVNLAVTEEKTGPVKLFLGKPEHIGHSTIVSSEATLPQHRTYFSKESIDVQCDTLENIITDNNIQMHIDILHIDAEGKTLDILDTFNFKKYRPSYISVDILMEDFDPNRHDLQKIMDQNNYKFVHSSGQSIWKDNNGN